MSTTLTKQKNLYIKAKEAYYNTKGSGPVMTDSEFDKLESKIGKEDPEFIKGTGILGKKSDFLLTYPMPSLDKVHYGETKKLSRLLKSKFIQNKKICITPKLDGSSVQAVYNNGKLKYLVTRGNGRIGQEITFLAPFTTLPRLIDVPGRLVLRMEAVLLKTSAQSLGLDPSIARAVAAGALNRMTNSEVLGKLHFVVLRVLESGKMKTPLYTEGLKTALRQFKTVPFIEVPTSKDLTESDLKIHLTKLKEKFPYEIDGLVVHADTDTISNDNPKFAFSFKMNDESDTAPLTTIKEIVWQVSSFNVAVPKARITPIDFNGVTVKYVSLSNWKLASKNGWGVGAKVRVVRSGEIIPKIVKTEKKAVLEKPVHLGKLSLDKTGTNLLVEGGSLDAKARTLTRFFKAGDLDGFGPALAGELAKDNLTTANICLMREPKDWYPYASPKTSVKLATEITKFVANPKLATVMAYSGSFGKGVGQTRIQSLIDANPTIVKILSFTSANTEPFTEKEKLSIFDRAVSTPGCGKVFAQELLNGLDEWYSWKYEASLVFKEKLKVKPRKGYLSGQCVTFTGYRDKEEEDLVAKQGGVVVPFGSKTTILMYDVSGKESSKVSKAKEKKIKVISRGMLPKSFKQ